MGMNCLKTCHKKNKQPSDERKPFASKHFEGFYMPVPVFKMTIIPFHFDKTRFQNEKATGGIFERKLFIGYSG
jgi:hypothetical protein